MYDEEYDLIRTNYKPAGKFLLGMRPSVFLGLDMKAEWKNTYSKIKTLEYL